MQVKTGRFQSASEVIRAGLRKLEEDESKLAILRAKLQAGENSPIVADFSEEAFIEKMHKKYVK